MSRIWVSNNADTARASVDTDHDGAASAYCHADDCVWSTDPERRDSLHEVLEEAGLHMDHNHE